MGVELVRSFYVFVGDSVVCECARSWEVWWRECWSVEKHRAPNTPNARPRAVLQSVGWVWRQPARPSACCKVCGVRTSSQSGGLAERAWQHGQAQRANTPDLRLGAVQNYFCFNHSGRTMSALLMGVESPFQTKPAFLKLVRCSRRKVSRRCPICW